MVTYEVRTPRRCYEGAPVVHANNPAVMSPPAATEPIQPKHT